jgi:NADH-quinone oxidoreductase subunit G
VDYEFLFDIHAKAIVSPSQMAQTLASIAACFPGAGSQATDVVKTAIAGAKPDDTQRAIASALKDADVATVILGNVASAHPQFSMLKALAAVIAKASGATLGVLTDGCNSAGGWLAGALPHRGPAGSTVAQAGLDAHAMLATPRKGYLLFGAEPEYDCADAALAARAIASAEVVVSVSPYASDAMKAQADVLLPVGTFAETSGTYINAEGCWQSFAGVASPYGESRPGWKVLRVLANQFGLDGFEQTSSEEIRDALRAQSDQAGQAKLDNSQAAGAVAGSMKIEGLERIGDVPIHSVDALVRRSASLQATPDAGSAGLLRLNSVQAEKSGVRDGYTVHVKQGDASVTLDVEINDRVADGCVWVQAGTTAAASLGAGFGPIIIERV